MCMWFFVYGQILLTSSMCAAWVTGDPRSLNGKSRKIGVIQNELTFNYFFGHCYAPGSRSKARFQKCYLKISITHI